METPEDKLKIAEYMGAIKDGILYRPDGTPHSKGGILAPFTADDLLYDSSWDWLMPVIKKIRYTVNEEYGFLRHMDYHQHCYIDPYNQEIEECFEKVAEAVNYILAHPLK